MTDSATDPREADRDDVEVPTEEQAVIEQEAAEQDVEQLDSDPTGRVDDSGSGAAAEAPGFAEDASDDDQTDEDESDESDGAESDESDESDGAESDQDESDEDESDEDQSDGEQSGRSAKLVALDDEGDIAADYLEELLDIADLDGDIDTFTEGGRAHVSIVTNATVLVGKDGDVLEALQDLCRLAVMTETGKRSRLMLDIAGHRDKRRRELSELATDAVQEAKDSGEPVRLTPMNPFERKIVHDVVAAAGLTSESEGEEPNRRVVVLPA